MSNNRKNREGIVYSTIENYQYQTGNNQEPDTLLPNEQKLIISLDKKQRAGKQVSLISGFIGKEVDLQILTKLLKNKCGVGGSAKDGEIIIQGDLRDKIGEILKKEGYQIKMK